MKHRMIPRLPQFCILGLAVALTVPTAIGQNTPAPNTQAPRAPQTQSPHGSPETTNNPTAATATGASMFLTTAIEMNSAEIQLSKVASTKAQNDRVKTYAQMLVKDHTAGLEKLQKLQTATTRLPPSSSNPAGGASGAQNPASPTGPDRNLPVLNEEHQRVLTRLTGSSGSQFDREYMDAMVNGHRDAVRMFEQQAGAAPDGSTRTGNTGAAGQPPTTGRGTPGTPPAGNQQEPQTDRRSTTSSSPIPSPTEVAALAREMLPTLRQHLEQAEQIQKTLK